MAQGELDEQAKIFYRDEISGAFLLNSDGWGLNFRYAKRVDAANKFLYDFDFAILKHPKEYRLSSQYAYGRVYVLGKHYIPFIFRGSYGKQKEIFRKFDVGGISIRRFISIGPSVALLKPIYYEINDNGNVKVEKFDPNIFNMGYFDPPVIGRASFFKGFDELKVIPGAFLKFGLSFEYSKEDKVLHAIEVGAFMEGFAQKLPIMATTENYQFFVSLFVSYRFGKVLDPTVRKQKKAKKKEDFFY
ncbi:MAG TPA: hypothetical protein VIH57_14025 [Bacteroidales bacterium]